MSLCSRSAVIAVIAAVLGFSAVSPSHAEFTLNACCSSQVAEAFGRESLEAFMEENGIHVRMHTSNSEVCVERLKNGFSNLVGSAVQISQSDRNSGLIEIPICTDTLSVIVNAGNRVKNLSLQQLRDIFSDKITNWKDLGGDDLPIVLITPAKTTDAYKNFRQLIMGPQEIQNDLIAAMAVTAASSVKYIPGSISFIANSIALNHKEVAVLSIDGLHPADAGYPYHQTFSMVLKGEPDPMMKEVIKYLMSDKARKRMTMRGMKPVIDNGR